MATKTFFLNYIMRKSRFSVLKVYHIGILFSLSAKACFQLNIREFIIHFQSYVTKSRHITGCGRILLKMRFKLCYDILYCAKFKYNVWWHTTNRQYRGYRKLNNYLFFSIGWDHWNYFLNYITRKLKFDTLKIHHTGMPFLMSTKTCF